MNNKQTLAGLGAWLFVVIWSTGFVVARGITGLVDPYLFLLLRFVCVLMIFLSLMQALRLPWPDSSARWRLMGIGALMQGLYLGPAFWAVSGGLEAGVMALLGALQPPLTALLAWHFQRERMTRKLVLGLLIGIAGVSLAVTPGLAQGGTAGISLSVILAALLSIGSITAGTLLQKSSIISVPLLASISFQTLGAVLVMAAMTLLFGQWQWPGSPEAFAYLAYAVFVLSIGGFTLLTWLVRHGSATRASSLLLLVPPLAAILSWVLYDEALGSIQLAGFAMALLGVLIARDSTA